MIFWSCAEYWCNFQMRVRHIILKAALVQICMKYAEGRAAPKLANVRLD